jgi:hypothetical protein
MQQLEIVEFRAVALQTIRRHLFILVAGIAVVVKLWLTSEIRIIPFDGPADMTNFIDHARSITAGMWFGTYTNLTLVKRPFFAIYLALLHDFGISLPLGHLLLYALACFVACLSIRPMIKGQAALAGVFIVLLFNPFTYNLDAWIANRSQVNPSAALIAIACAVAIFLRRNERPLVTLPWACGLGLSLAAFWLTREEAVWIVPSILIFLGAYAVFTLRENRSELALRSLTVALPLAIWSVCVATIMILNGRYYGWYVVDEQTAPELVSAYNSLARINVPPVPFVPVPKAAREIAYRVSPAARELKRGFDVETGWIRISCRVRNVCTDYGGGYFIWAFRDAVSMAGHYTSGAAARAFYLQLAKEIDAACDAKTIDCLPKARTTLPPVHTSDIPSIAAWFGKGMTTLGTFFGPGSLGLVVSVYDDPPASALHDYDVIVQSVADTSDQRYFTGWLLHKRMKAIVAEGSDGTRIPVQFISSPDVFHAFKIAGRQYDHMNAGTARFHVTVPCIRTCSLVATTFDNKEIRLALDHDFQNSDFFYHLDNSTINSPYQAGDDQLKISIIEFISHAYQVLVPWCALASIALFAWRAIELLTRRSRSVDYVLVVFGIGAGCCVLVFLLAVMSALTYDTFVPEYMSPLFPFLLFGCAFAIVVQLQGAHQALRSSGLDPGIVPRSPQKRARTSSVD